MKVRFAFFALALAAPADAHWVKSNQAAVVFDSLAVADSLFLGPQSGTSGIKYSDLAGIPDALHRGAWNANTAYAVGDIVVYDGGLYYCTQAVPANRNADPPSSDTSRWERLDFEPVVGEGLVLDNNTLRVLLLQQSGLAFSGDSLFVKLPLTAVLKTKLDNLRRVAAGAGLRRARTADRDTLAALLAQAGGLGLTDSGDSLTLRLDGSTLALDADGLRVALPLTAALKAKLDGIEADAEVNPPRTRKFAVQDNNIRPFATNLQPGEWGLYDGATQVQSGSISQADTIFLAERTARFGTDPTAPGTNLQAEDVSDLFGDAVKHGGSLILALRQGTRLAYAQAETIAELRAGGARKGWKLYNLSWYDAFTLTGSGYNWQIVAGFSSAFFLDDGLGLLSWSKLSGVPDFVTDEELRGRESDRYASYTNAFIAAGYRRGAMSLFTQSTGPPTDAHAVGQPDIADRATDGIIAVSTFLRTDRDPNALVWAAESAAADYTTGQVLYISVWDYPQAHVKVTLTSNGTLVGAGDAAYIWATATWDEVEDIPDVVDYGNYFLIAEYQPSDLQVRLPASDILDPPWLDADLGNAADVADAGGTKIRTWLVANVAPLATAVRDWIASHVTAALKAAIQGSNETEELGDFTRVAAGLESQGDNRYSVSGNAITFSVAAGLTTPGTNDYRLNEAIKERAWVRIGSYEAEITSFTARYLSNTRALYGVVATTVAGTPPALATVSDVQIIGEDIHRGQVTYTSFRVHASGTAHRYPRTDGTGDTTFETPLATIGTSETEQKLPTAGAVVKAVKNRIETVVATDTEVAFASGVYTVTPGAALGAYVEGVQVLFESAAANTGATDINISSLGNKDIVREDGTQLQAGDIPADFYAHLLYDGLFFVLINRRN